MVKTSTKSKKKIKKNTHTASRAAAPSFDKNFAKKKNISQTPAQKKSSFFLLRHHFQLMWRVTLITVLTMGVLGGTGYILDKNLGRFPLFMAAGLIIAYPVAQIITYKVFKTIAKNKSWKVRT